MPLAAEIDELPLRDDLEALERREDRVRLCGVYVELTIARPEGVRESGPGVRSDPALPSVEDTPPLPFLLWSLCIPIGVCVDLWRAASPRYRRTCAAQ